MSIFDSLSESLETAHRCTSCRHREGDWCQWSNFQAGLPHHVTWWSIDWDNPDCAEDCSAYGAVTGDQMEG